MVSLRRERNLTRSFEKTRSQVQSIVLKRNGSGACPRSSLRRLADRVLRRRRVEPPGGGIGHEGAVAERPDARPAGHPECFVHADLAFLGPARQGLDQRIGLRSGGPDEGSLVDLGPVREPHAPVGDGVDLRFLADLDAPFDELPFGVAAEFLGELGQDHLARMDEDHAHLLARDVRVELERLVDEVVHPRDRLDACEPAARQRS